MTFQPVPVCEAKAEPTTLDSVALAVDLVMLA